MKHDAHADPFKPMYCSGYNGSGYNGCNNRPMRQALTGIGMTWACDNCGQVVYHQLSRAEQQQIKASA